MSVINVAWLLVGLMFGVGLGCLLMGLAVTIIQDSALTEPDNSWVVETERRQALSQPAGDKRLVQIPVA